jgi:16S rRNA (guanine966-N2)-methyltransferase
MRIVAGRFRGRTISGPSTGEIRPTSDRLRETIFNILEHAYGDPVPGARVLDLFAGTGAMGLEALSRGASFCLFVDQGAEARSLMRGSVEALGCGGEARIFRRDATKLGDVKPLAPFSLVFCDPPYGRGLAPRALTSALEGGFIADEAVIVVEEAKTAEFTFPEGFHESERRGYGDTIVVFGRRGASG